MNRDFKETVSVLVLFCIACLAYRNQQFFDLCKLIFEAGFVLLFSLRIITNKLLFIICMIVLFSITYAMIKELLHIGTMSTAWDSYVGVSVGIGLLITIIVQFFYNAK
jgi:hypothetical protein